MSESPIKEAPTIDKETAASAPAHSDDVEKADLGIVVHAAPLARKLKGRHMQMIAIGNSV
jgi:yeast amino acid transporter